MSTSGAKKSNSPKTPRGKQRNGASREARRVAAVILDVLAGMRTPSEAAEVLSVSVPRYYALERRAVESLVANCEPRSGGSVPSPQQRIAELQREVQRLRQQSDRHLALARATQRTVGLAMPGRTTSSAKEKGNTAGATSSGKKRRGRRPTVRALKAADALRDPPNEAEPTPSVAETVSVTANS